MSYIYHSTKSYKHPDFRDMHLCGVHRKGASENHEKLNMVKTQVLKAVLLITSLTLLNLI